MWDSLLDYGKMEWKHTLAMFQKHPEKKVNSLNSLTKLGACTKLFVLGMERRLGGATNHQLAIVSYGNFWGFGSHSWMSCWVCCVCTSLFYNGFFHLCPKKRNKKGFENF
jgi:hypothetical protein